MVTFKSPYLLCIGSRVLKPIAMATIAFVSPLLFRQSLVRDPCSEPRVKERVPYVVVYGSPGLPLIQLIKRLGVW